MIGRQRVKGRSDFVSFLLAAPLAVVLAAVVMLSGSVPARAGTLYGLSSSTPGSVYTIDPTTGAATLVTNLTSGSVEASIVGLEARNGTLYATNVRQDRYKFGTIDLTTGAFTALNDQARSDNWRSLAYNPTLDLFYTLDRRAEALFSVTPDGATISFIGGNTDSVAGLAYDSNHNILYAVTSDELYTLNTGTAASTRIGTTGLATNGLAGLAYDSENDILYLNRGGSDNHLYRLDVATGAATSVGSNGATAGSGIDGLGFVVPEPGSLALLGLGALGLVRRARRRRNHPR